MNDQRKHYTDKLAYQIDSWDLSVALDEKAAVTVVDARSTEAFEREHIPGALNLPHRTMTAQTTSGVDRDTLVVTYCDGIGCNASTKAALNMLDLGFNVKELIGGLDWWKRDGHATHAGVGSESSQGCGYA